LGESDEKIGRGWQKIVKACRKAVKSFSAGAIVWKRLRLVIARLSFLASRWQILPGMKHHRKTEGANGRFWAAECRESVKGGGRDDVGMTPKTATKAAVFRLPTDTRYAVIVGLTCETLLPNSSERIVELQHDVAYERSLPGRLRVA
jgi:hypothetical protein